MIQYMYIKLLRSFRCVPPQPAPATQSIQCLGSGEGLGRGAGATGLGDGGPSGGGVMSEKIAGEPGGDESGRVALGKRGEGRLRIVVRAGATSTVPSDVDGASSGEWMWSSKIEAGGRRRREEAEKG